MTFTDEELQKLGISEGDKFSVEVTEDGGLSLKKFVSISLDMADWSREALEHIIKESCDTDKSVNEVIATILEEKIQTLEQDVVVDKYNLIQYT